MKGSDFLEMLGEDHPITSIISWHNDFKKDLIELIDFLNEKGIKNLDIKLNELRRDKENWESYLCELKFCKRIVALSPQFIPSKKKGPTPDIKVFLSNEEIFFEVKLLKNMLLRDMNINTELFKRINKIISDYLVIINYDPLAFSEEYAEKAYQLVLTKIEEHKTGKFHINNVLEIEIKEKKEVARKFKKESKTWVIFSVNQIMWIDIKELKKKMLLDFYNKLKQFRSVKNIFWVIDLKRWQYDIGDLKDIFYGDVVSDYTTGIKNFVGFEEIYEVFRRTPELLDDTNLLPCFSYPQRNGLFFYEDFKILNGVIGIKNDKSSMLINPFAQNQLDISTVRKLKGTINK